jgi:hypothetical protein
MRNKGGAVSQSCEPAGVRVHVMDTALVIGLWLAAVALANPLGEFALNDDWSYARTVRDLLESGRFKPCGWGAMTLVAHTLWGALFCLPFGFSFTALKVSMITLGAGGLAGVCGICRALKLPRWVLWMTAVMVGFNPLYFVLSCTYMTDVTGAVLAAGAAWFFVCHLRGAGAGSRVPPLLLGTALSVAAVFTRQVSLAVPMAFACVSLACVRRGRWAGHLAAALLPLLVCVLSYGVFMGWLHSGGVLPPAYDHQTDTVWETLRNPELVYQRLAEAFQLLTAYMGWFLFPLIAVALAARPPRGWAGWLSLGAVAAVTIVILSLMAIYVDEDVMPWAQNVINRYGFGPMLLGSEPSINGSGLIWLARPVPQAYWWVVTAAGVSGGIALFWFVASRLGSGVRRLCQRRGLEGGHGAILFLILAIPAYMLPLMLSYPFDRHLLPCTLLTGLALLLHIQGRTGAVGSRVKILCWCVLLPLSLGTVAGAHDYIEINRVKWRAADDLMRSGVSVGRIDAGFEFNGYYKHTPETRWMGTCPNRPFGTSYEDYVISNLVYPGYAIMAAYPARCWLPGNRLQILVLRAVTVRRPGPFAPGR